MTLAQTIQLEGFAAQASVSADTWIVLSGKAASLTQFQGVLEIMPGIDPRMDLGSDIRELGVLHVVRSICPVVESQDTLSQITGDNTPTWKVIRREDNPGDIVVRLWMAKVVPGVDSI